MKFSTKSRYALRLMAELARYAPGTTVSLKEISERLLVENFMVVLSLLYFIV